MHKEIINSIEPELEKAVDFVFKKLSSVRTGRATPALVENIKADCFGQEMPIKQLAAISTPNSRQIAIQPWDRSYLESIEKAILNEQSGLSPIVTKSEIIINLPAMSEDFRKELVRIIAKTEEDGKQTMRKYRDEAWSRIQKECREGNIREDDKFKAKDDLQKLLDKYFEKVEKISENKKREIEK